MARARVPTAMYPALALILTGTAACSGQTPLPVVETRWLVCPADEPPGLHTPPQPPEREDQVQAYIAAVNATHAANTELLGAYAESRQACKEVSDATG